MDIFRIRKIALISLYTALACAILALCLQFQRIVLYSLFAVSALGVLAFILLSLLFWKCPHCGKHFDIRHGKMDGMTKCPKCGASLLADDNKK